MNFQNESTDFIWKSVYDYVLNSLPTEVERKRMHRYFPLMLTHEQSGDEYVIGVAEQIQVEMFSEYYASLIEEALEVNGRPGLKVTFKVTGSQKNQSIVQPPAQPPVQPVIQSTVQPSLQPSAQAPYMQPYSQPVVSQPQFSQPHVQEAEMKQGGLPFDWSNSKPDNSLRDPYAVNQMRAAPIKSTMPLHENYVFETFVKGPSNSFAHAAAIAVAKGPGRTSYNPLFIYGGTGLGKTHLMEAIGHYVIQKNPYASVCYLTSETFLNEFINALQNDAMQAFRDKYRKVDLLLLDDVQFIAGKQQFQEEFFNTFNSLMNTRKQIVMTSDVSPKDLKGCEERLTGRFQMGMVVEIESPSYETRLAILKSKAASSHVLVPEEILKYIAENIRSHVRAIEGALNRVVTFISLNHGMILTLEIAKHLLKDSIEEEKTIKSLTINDIINGVCSFYSVKAEDILSSARNQNIVIPRQIAMFLAYKLTGKSFPEIGIAFNRTHATIYHGCQTIQGRMEVDGDLRKKVEELTSNLGRKISEIS